MSCDPKTLKVLLVPDSIHWVTGTIAAEIASKVPGIDATVCSAPLVRKLVSACGGSFPKSFDVVHFLTPHIATSFFPAFSRNSACIATIHHVENELSIEPAPYVDGIMTVCRQWHDYLVSHGIEEDRLTLVHNGIDAQLYRPANYEERLQLRKRFKIPEDAFVIGFSAKKSSDSSSRKGIKTLERLIVESNLNLQSAWWIIRGPGWQSVAEQLQRYGARIIHIPFLLNKDEVAETYRLMDSYVVTASIEGGPVPLIEAMSSGLSCITTRVGIAPEIIEDGVNGFFVENGDVEKYLEKLRLLEKNRDLHQQIGLSARQTVANSLTWYQALENVPVLYERSVLAFHKRKFSSLDQKKHYQDSYSLEWSEDFLKKWIAKRELLVLVDLLKSEGEHKRVRQLADEVLLKNLFDREMWSCYGLYSSLSIIIIFYFKLKGLFKRVLRKFGLTKV